MEKKENNRIYFLILRYIILLIISIPNLWLFYAIFTPLTIYPVYFLLNLFYNVSLQATSLIFDTYPAIELIPACIAGSAYFLLLILNLTTPMKLKKRFFSLIFLLLSFLLINILRIFFFSILFFYSFTLFNFTHLMFWFVFSSIIVFLLWILNIKIFKIKQIPVYNDIKFLYGKMKSN